jgi:2-haloacid dehalogenase
MVAAHPSDLRAASESGLKTAYVPRPLEFGPGKEADLPDPDFDLVVSDFIELDRKLACLH